MPSKRSVIFRNNPPPKNQNVRREVTSPDLSQPTCLHLRHGGGGHPRHPPRRLSEPERQGNPCHHHLHLHQEGHEDHPPGDLRLPSHCFHPLKAKSWEDKNIWPFVSLNARKKTRNGATCSIFPNQPSCSSSSTETWNQASVVSIISYCSILY